MEPALHRGHDGIPRTSSAAPQSWSALTLAVALAVALALTSACAVPRTSDVPGPVDGPAMRPIGDARNWKLEEPMVYRVEQSADSVVIPAGFVTDFASIPTRLQSLISPLGPHLYPAIMHDYLYWEQSCTRPQVDSLFLKAMVEMRVPRLEMLAMYQAVRRFGQKSWDKNTRDRALGLPRVIPGGEDVRRPTPSESWPDYRSYLQREHLDGETRVTQTPAFCRHGGPSELAADASFNGSDPLKEGFLERAASPG